MGGRTGRMVLCFSDMCGANSIYKKDSRLVNYNFIYPIIYMISIPHHDRFLLNYFIKLPNGQPTRFLRRRKIQNHPHRRRQRRQNHPLLALHRRIVPCQQGNPRHHHRLQNENHPTPKANHQIVHLGHRRIRKVPIHCLHLLQRLPWRHDGLRSFQVRISWFR